MKKLIGICFIAGVLVGCSAPQEEPETTVIFKRQLYETIFEWACYRECAIVAYMKLHHVSREKATAVIEKIVVDAKEAKFDAWYREQKEKGRI